MFICFCHAFSCFIEKTKCIWTNFIAATKKHAAGVCKSVVRFYRKLGTPAFPPILLAAEGMKLPVRH